MHKIKLGPDDDRVVSIEVTDKHGEIYRIGLEFLNHDFNEDEVQVTVSKPGGSSPDGKSRYVHSPNRILYNERVVGQKGHPEEALSHGVWFEFHDVGELPRVRSKAWSEAL